MNLSKLALLKEKAESLRRERDEKVGELKALNSQLKKEFGCPDIGSAKTILAKLQRQEQEAERDFDKAMKAFEKKWGSLIIGGENEHENQDRHIS